MPPGTEARLAELGARPIASSSPTHPEASKEAKRMRKAFLKKDGKCTAVVKEPRKPGEWDRVERFCCAAATRLGLCRKHYNRKYLKVLANLPGGPRRRVRPFAGWQLPGSMSDQQHDCLRGLPIETAYGACISAMNEADPGNLLTPIFSKPGSRKSTR